MIFTSNKRRLENRPDHCLLTDAEWLVCTRQMDYLGINAIGSLFMFLTGVVLPMSPQLMFTLLGCGFVLLLVASVYHQKVLWFVNLDEKRHEEKAKQTAPKSEN